MVSDDMTPIGSREVSRRRHLKWLVLGSATALAGCTGGGGRERTTTAGDRDDGTVRDTGGSGSETTPAPEIRQGGNLRIADGADPQSLHPMIGTNDYSIEEFMYSRLVDITPEIETAPLLATDWEGNDAKDEWTFTLTEDAVFSNTGGQSVLAEDVQATVDVMQSEDRVSSAARDLGPLDTTEVLDDHRIRFHLTRSDIVYPKRLGETGSTFSILPKNVIEDRWDEIPTTDFGSGPFTLREFQEGDQYVFEARPDQYFKSDENGNALPYVDRITWKIIPDVVSRVNTLADQRIDAMLDLPPSQRQRAEGATNVTVDGFTTPAFISVVLNTSVETDDGDRPLADPKVRKAIKHAVDREEMVAAVGDTAAIGHHDPVAPVQDLYGDFPEGLEFGTTHQPDEARSLLDEAGYADGVRLPNLVFSIENNPRKEVYAPLFQEQMNRVGIEFDLQQVTSSAWLSDYWNQDGVWYLSSYAARLEETTVHSLALRSEGPWNSGRWSNEEYDEAYRSAVNATDRETFEESFTEAQRIHHLDGTWIICGFNDQYAPYNDYVRDVEPRPASDRGYHWDAWLTSDAPEGPAS